jgi:hypothetical protein
MDPLGVVVLLGVGASAAAYTALNWHLHRRALRRLDPEVCAGGASHLWNIGYQYAPSTKPVEEECDCCLARRVVDYGDGHVEPRVLRYLPPQD